MKKLIAMSMTLAVAFGASADGLKQTVTFEASGYDVMTSDAGFWHSSDSESFTVTAYSGGAYSGYTANETYANGGAPTASSPGSNYLAIETSNPLYRTINSTTHEFSNTSLSDGNQTISDGLFVDTLVKFTATEDLSVPDLAGGRLAVWLGTDEQAPSVTNLYVTAAAVDSNGTLTPTNFPVLAAGQGFPEAWHRLTIRAIAGIGTDVLGGNLIGFTVFVDGQQVAYTGNDYATLVARSLDNKVSSFVAEKQLFIGCTTGSTLEAVGFKGTGSVDDITFADYANAPTFAKGVQTFTFTWDADEVAAITIGQTTLSAQELAAEEYVLNDLTAGTVAISVTFAEGYTGTTSDNVTLTPGASYAIVAQAAKFAIGNVNYATFADALEEASADDTIKLNANVSETIAFGGSYEISTALTIDLAGKTWNITSNDGIAFNNKAALTIISSVAGGTINFTGNDYIVDDEAALTIGSTTGDQGVTIIGRISNGTYTSIVKGRFDDVGNGDEGAFIYESVITGGGSSNHNGGYYEVGMGGGQQQGSWNDAAQGSTAGAVWGASVPQDLQGVDSQQLADWASYYNVNLGDTIKVNAFLLNCANTDEAIATAEENFTLTITFVNGEPVIGYPSGYNGTVTVQGSAAIPFSWHAQTTGDKFFRAVLAPTNIPVAK